MNFKSLFRFLFILLIGASLSSFAAPPRVANTTLRMPARLPSFGYAIIDAFGLLSFTNPVAIATPPGETNRLFVVEQRGRIVVITNLTSPNSTMFLDLSPVVTGGVPGDERGLLGLAFHPGYASNGFFYVTYSLVTNTPGVANNALHQRISRFQVDATNPNLANSASELVLINQFDEAGNHNGGDLHFGPDGYLYVSLGDEGGGNDQYNNSQRIDRDYFSAILRMDVDKRSTNLAPNAHPSVMRVNGAANYAVPADNPFIGATQYNATTINPANVRTEFWAVGLRNPWRFSFDRSSGELYCADVGQSAREEVNLITRGGDYGWAYREGYTSGPKQRPANANPIPPILDYGRGNGTNQGASVTGGVVYRGNRISQLYGQYIFADYVSGNIWAARPGGTTNRAFDRIAGAGGIAGFGIDPRNGDVLLADQSTDRIRRLTYATITTGTPVPQTLADTGAFADLVALTPNPGIQTYEVNVPFWSDNAVKRRWFSVPNTNLDITFKQTSPWLFPTGTVWVKHFELELTNGVPESARRLETRLLVKNSEGVYGVTYRWGDSLTNATLVPEQGLDESFVVHDGGITRTQVWHYPSRSECLACHTPAAGFALGFNTAQLNRDFVFSDGRQNQIHGLEEAGYFANSVSNRHVLPALAASTNDAVSVEYRVRSYLAVNCAQCHQPGGPALGTWDASIENPLSASGLIRGALFNPMGDPANRVVVPGDAEHSMLLTRMLALDGRRMPPIGSNLIDAQGVALVRLWITNALANYASYAEWQFANFSSTNAANTGRTEDFDFDGSLNEQEYLLNTDPRSAASRWEIAGSTAGENLQIQFDRIANRGFEVQFTTNLFAPWQVLDVPSNAQFFSATNEPATILAPLLEGSRYFRVRTFEP